MGPAAVQPCPGPQAGPWPPTPSLGAQDDVDAGIREHGPTHLPRPQCKGGVFKGLLHLTWGSVRRGVRGSRPGRGAGCVGQAEGAPLCASLLLIHQAVYGPVTGAAGPLRRPREAEDSMKDGRQSCCCALGNTLR